MTELDQMMTSKLLAIGMVVLSISLLSIILSEAQAGTRGLEIKTASGKVVGDFQNSHAILIGVSDYTAGWPDLGAVPAELDEVERLLKLKGFTVTKSINPTSKTLRADLEAFVDQYGFDEASRLLFFFSGHGYSRDNGAKGYLVPSDAPNPEIDERGFLRKSYSMTSLLALARNIESRHALFLFDSCFSGTIFQTRALTGKPPLITALTNKPVRQFITAGSAGEEVPAKSVFTPAFLEALEYGTGDLNQDGYVTGSELGMYLQDVVSSASGQTPQYGKISDFELSRGDYVFSSGADTPTTVASLGVTRLPPSGGDFNLDDLTEKVDANRALETAWDLQLTKMKSAYSKVLKMDVGEDVSDAIKAAAWQRFVEVFSDDNPFETYDNDMLAVAKKTLSRLQQLPQSRNNLADPKVTELREVALPQFEQALFSKTWDASRALQGVPIVAKITRSQKGLGRYWLQTKPGISLDIGDSLAAKVGNSNVELKIASKRKQFYVAYVQNSLNRQTPDLQLGTPLSLNGETLAIESDNLLMPVVRTSPIIPRSVGRVSGYCTLLLDVSADGRAVNIQPSDCQQREEVASAVLAAAESLMFLPEMENGRAVERKAVSYRYDL